MQAVTTCTTHLLTRLLHSNPSCPSVSSWQLIRTAVPIMVYFFGTALYVGLLLTNAIAILSEERFLAKSKLNPRLPEPPPVLILLSSQVGWSTLSYSQAQQSANAGFGNVPHDPYSSFGAGGNGNGEDALTGQQGIKQRLIALISAVRTLMRSESQLGYGEKAIGSRDVSTVDRGKRVNVRRVSGSPPLEALIHCSLQYSLRTHSGLNKPYRQEKIKLDARKQATRNDCIIDGHAFLGLLAVQSEDTSLGKTHRRYSQRCR